MIQEKNEKPILIYFKTRGTAQIIRCVLLQIQIEFQQIFVNFNGTIDSSIYWNQTIDMKSLPYFIHNGVKIVGIFPIIKYICNIWGRQDLLGKNFQQSVIIAQIMTKQIRSKAANLNNLIKGINQIHQKNLGKQGVQKLKKKILQSYENEKLLKPIRNMFQKTGQFLCGHITVLDFAYYDKAFYGVNFNTQDTPELKLAFQYVKFFRSTSFFKKNQHKLEQYKIILPQLANIFSSIVKQIWLGDPKFITIE